jgi:hypothetical protein
MIEPMPTLDAWHDFYVMMGSGAAALTGLLFVIVSLGPHIVARSVATGVRSFISPIAVHFTAAMVLSAIMLAPDVPRILLGASLAVGGAGLIVYMFWTRANTQWLRNRLPILDWVWYIGLPLVAFAAIVGSGVAIIASRAPGLHVAATATVLLIVIGIRNAWDIVVWMTTRQHGRDAAASDDS